MATPQPPPSSRSSALPRYSATTQKTPSAAQSQAARASQTPAAASKQGQAVPHAGQPLKAAGAPARPTTPSPYPYSLAQKNKRPSTAGVVLIIFALIIGLIAVCAMIFLYYKNPSYWEKSWVFVLTGQLLLIFIPLIVLFRLPTAQVLSPPPQYPPSYSRPSTAQQPAQAAPKIVEIKEEDVELVDEGQSKTIQKLGEREVINYPLNYKPAPEYITTLTMIPIDDKRMFSLKVPVSRK